jgi:phosphatidylglycerol:prolipoprotein diacylglycerol transferase
MYPDIVIGNTAIPLWYVFLYIGYIFALAGILSARPSDFSVSKALAAGSVGVYIVASIIGCILLNIIIHPQRYAGLSYQEAVYKLGSASLGGIVLGIFAVWLLSREANFSFMDIADLGMPFAVLTLAFNRIGCLLAGCCYGIATALPWGFKFLADGIIRHPTQAYEMAVNFAIFGSSRFIYKNLRQHKGLTFYYIIFVYSFVRFFNEFLRQEGPRIIGQLKFSHPFLFVTATIGLIGIWNRIKLFDKEEKERMKFIFINSSIRFIIWFCISISFPLTIIYISNRIW